MPYTFPEFVDRDVLEAVHVNDIQDAIVELEAGKAPVVHGHVAADVTDFAETARDTLASALVAGANVTITPDDNANTITIASTGGGATHDPVTIQDTTSINLTLAGQELYAAAIFGTTATTIAAGNHTHTQAQSHGTPDTDTATTALHHTLGTGANQAAAGNDARLSDARTPLAHNQAASTINSGTLAIAQIPTGQTGTTVPLGNDARFTDARTPTAHVHSGADITTGKVPVAQLGTGTPSGTTYLDGTGAWSTPAGGGGVGGAEEYNRYIFAPTLPQLQQLTQHHPARGTGTYTVVAGAAYFYALITPVDLTIDGIGVGVNTALAGTILAAVWSSEAAVLGNQRLRPRALLSGIGSIDTGTTGRKLGTFTAYMIPKNTPVFLMFRPSSACNLLSMIPGSSLYPTNDATLNNTANLLIANSPAVSTAMTEVSPAVGTSSNNTPNIEWRVTAIGT